MRSDGWLSSKTGCVFAAAMLAVMLVTGLAGFYLDASSFAVGVLGSVFAIALGLLIGYLVVDRFADYVVERQWAKSREYTLRAIAVHMTAIAWKAIGCFGCVEPETMADLFESGRTLAPDAAECFPELVTEVRQVFIEENFDCHGRAVEFRKAIAENLDDVSTALMERLFETSRNPELLDALMELDNRRRCMDLAIAGREVPIKGEPTPFLILLPYLEAEGCLELLEACGRAYRIAAEERSRCLPDNHPMQPPRADHDRRSCQDGEAMSEDVWYFAYGSNLSKEQMICRTGHLPESQRVSLPGYRFVFNKLSKDGTLKASIGPAEGETVYGVVYWCTPEDMKEIDKSEGANIGHYSRETIEVVGDDGSPLEAEVYIACDEHIREDGSPSECYVNRIVTGAEEHGLPEDYIQKIRSAAEAGTGNGA